MRKPDLKSQDGNIKIYKLNWKSETPDQEATLSAYLVEAQGFHALWNQWIMSVITLADFEGVPPAIKDSPEMTHEVITVSVNPKVKLDPDVTPKVSFMLTPVDLQKQFKVPSDEDAIQMLEGCVKMIAEGVISPDSDFRRQWGTLIENTADHAYGKHDKCKH